MSICKISAIIILGLMAAGCATSSQVAPSIEETKSPTKKSKSSESAMVGEVQVPIVMAPDAVEPLPITYVEVEMPRIATQVSIASAQAASAPASTREIAPTPTHRSMQPVEDDPTSAQKWEWVERTPPGKPLAPTQSATIQPNRNNQSASLVASLAPLPIEALP